jgi:hypothetical protein
MLEPNNSRTAQFDRRKTILKKIIFTRGQTDPGFQELLDEKGGKK